MAGSLVDAAGVFWSTCHLTRPLSFA